MAAGRFEFRLILCLLLVVTNDYYNAVSAQTTIQPLSLNVFAGENAVFDCNSNDVPANVVWQWFQGDYANAKPLASENVFALTGYELIVYNGRQTSRITILNTTMEDDQTQYYCQFGSTSKVANLTVIAGTRLDPSYPQCEADITAVNTMNTVTMTCRANGGDPRPLLQWYRNGVKLKEQNDLFGGISYSDEYVHTLTFEDEEAVFMCKAEVLAVDGSQTCDIQQQLKVPPTVMITYTTTSFTAGDALEFICIAMSPWNITDYMWNVGNQLVTTSNSILNLTDDKTMLIMINLQSGDAGTEIECKAVTASGLSGSNSVIISLTNETNVKVVAIVVGGLIFLILCIITFILVRRRRKENKASINKPVNLVERTYRKHSTGFIAHGVPLDNPNFISEENAIYRSNGSHIPPPVRIKLKDQNYDDNIDVHADTERDPGGGTSNGFETYTNTGSIASFGSFCSFNSFDPNCEEHLPRKYNNTGSKDNIDFDQLYAKPIKGTQSPDASSIDGIADFGDLYAKPIKGKQNPDTRAINGTVDFGELYAKPLKRRQNPDSSSIDGIADFGDLYAKPIKHRQSIHQSLENIIGTNKEDDTFPNRSESVDNLYSQPNKKRVTAPSGHFAEPDNQPDRKSKQASTRRPITYTAGPNMEHYTLPNKGSNDEPMRSLSNTIEQDFTYSSIA